MPWCVVEVGALVDGPWWLGCEFGRCNLAQVRRELVVIVVLWAGYGGVAGQDLGLVQPPPRFTAPIYSGRLARNRAPRSDEICRTSRQQSSHGGVDPTKRRLERYLES